MKTYRRIEQCAGYQRITDVSADGAYTQRAQWPDGKITNYYKDTIQAMGWSSVTEFLRARRHFVEIA